MQTGKAYSEDLREKVIEAYQAGSSTMQQVAKRFAVSRNWVNNLVQRYKQTGNIAAKPHRGGVTAKLTPKHYQVIEEIINKKNDVTLKEISQQIAEITGLVVSQPTICRALQRMELTRKKKHCTQTNKKQKQ